MPQYILSSRIDAAVAQINETEIAVFGGTNTDLASKLSDVVVFNTKTKQCQKMIMGGDFKFSAEANQCAHVGKDTVVALVTTNVPLLISFKKGESAFIILNEF